MRWASDVALKNAEKERLQQGNSYEMRKWQQDQWAADGIPSQQNGLAKRAMRWIVLVSGDATTEVQPSCRCLEQGVRVRCLDCETVDMGCSR